jgi:uncharacterized RDD family membrane protein YckC
VQDPRELLPAAPDSSGFVGSAGVGAVSAGYVPEVAKVSFVAQSETNSVSWADDSPHPWRRYFVRSLDLSLNGSITGLIVASLWAFIDEKVAERFLGYASENRILSSLFASFFAIPLDAILIGLTGCTLGKWFFGVRVLGADLAPIGIRAALQREFKVWLKGLALGLPLVMLIPLRSARSTLISTGSTTWDRSQNLVVRHRPTGAYQTALPGVGVALLWVMWAVARSL